MTGNLRYSRVNLYWKNHKSLEVAIIADNISINRFYKLRQSVHFVDVQYRLDNSTDRFWKVRPLYDSIRTRCLTLPLETQLCIDEQMVPFKGRLNVKQYVKNKPNPWGIKIYALCGKSGLLYFIIYQGMTTELVPIEKEVFGVVGGVVLKLCSRINEKNIQLYFDNFFRITM